jgi:hypothetical protein
MGAFRPVQKIRGRSQTARRSHVDGALIGIIIGDPPKAEKQMNREIVI